MFKYNKLILDRQNKLNSVIILVCHYKVQLFITFTIVVLKTSFCTNMFEATILKQLVPNFRHYICMDEYETIESKI